MAGVQGLRARVQRIEVARQPRKLHLALAFGSFAIFEVQIRAEVEAGSLDRTGWLGEDGDGGVLRCLRRWEEEDLI